MIGIGYKSTEGGTGLRDITDNIKKEALGGFRREWNKEGASILYSTMLEREYDNE
jgi:hypothetical protein